MIDANGDESTADEGTANAFADGSTMTLFAPQNIKNDIETMMNAVSGIRRSRIEQSVIEHMVSLLLLFSGFKIGPSVEGSETTPGIWKW